jgi:hypothetical protein
MNLKLDKNTLSVNILFLHHSTGEQIIRGGISRYKYKLTKKGNIHKWFKIYNKKNNTNYIFKSQIFPKHEPYGWNNYPYDYYNIWVKNSGSEAYMKEPTLEILTKKYDLIIFKHCFPVSEINDIDNPSIESQEKSIENYKLQYQALKEKMHEFKNTKFLIWTGPALVENATNAHQAKQAKIFFKWVTEEWDQKGDNIYIWDFYSLETDGGLYLKYENAKCMTDSHVSSNFARKVYPLFCKRIVDVIEGKGDERNTKGLKY